MRFKSHFSLLGLASVACLAVLDIGCGGTTTKKSPDASADAQMDHPADATPDVSATADAASDAASSDAPDAPATEVAAEVAIDPCAMCGANSICTAHAATLDGGADAASDAGDAGVDAADADVAEVDAGVDATTSSDAAPASPCVCKPGYAGDGITCVEVASSLEGLRWELPCATDDSATVCNAVPATKMSTLAGVTGKTYSVTLRFRGVIEQKTYFDGTRDGYWLVGGTPASDGYNVYKLQISSPAQTFYLNDGDSNIQNCWVIDYTKTIDMDANAVVTLSADTIDGEEIKNVDPSLAPLIVPDVPPAPAAYNGQFVQMDVVSVVAK